MMLKVAASMRPVAVWGEVHIQREELKYVSVV